MKKITLSILAILVLSTMTMTAQTVLINFAIDSSPMTTGNWNNVLKGTTTTTDSLSTIIDNTGASINLKLKVVDGFDGTNSSGYTTTLSDAAAAGFTGAIIAKQSLYNMTATGKSIIRIWGLDVNKVYTFTAYAGHMYPTAGEIKQTKYTVTGTNSATDTLNVSYNSSRVKTFTDIVPTSLGYIDIQIEAGPLNNGASKYSYLAALKIVGITPVATSLKNNETISLSARFADNNLIVGDYTGIVKVYAVNGKLVANGQAIFGNMPLNLQKGIYIVDTTQGKCKLLVH